MTTYQTTPTQPDDPNLTRISGWGGARVPRVFFDVPRPPPPLEMGGKSWPSGWVGVVWWAVIMHSSIAVFQRSEVQVTAPRAPREEELKRDRKSL
eukprot:2926704-Pyramimonas_sp.AAC.1